MKQITAILFLCLFGAIAQAQTSKGSWMLGSSVGVMANTPFSLQGPAADNHAGIDIVNTTLKTDGLKQRSNSTVVSFAPAIGYFSATGLLVGMNVNMAYLNVEENEPVFYATVAPLARCYVNNEAKVRPFVEGRVGITAIATKHQFPRRALLMGARGGAAIVLNEAVSLDLFLDYTYGVEHENLKRGIPQTQNSAFGVGVGFSFFL